MQQWLAISRLFERARRPHVRLSFPRKRESSVFERPWVPAFAGTTTRRALNATPIRDLERERETQYNIRFAFFGIVRMARANEGQ
jgi:hypothetical protein